MKRRAILWAQAHGYALCATEVRVPRSNFRADVAAARWTGSPEAVAVFECKQARADLLKDSAAETATLDHLKRVADRRRRLERLLGLHLPNLRKCESLFAELDHYDLDAIRHDGWRRVRRQEAQLKARVFGRTKFDRLRRYGVADFCYLVVLPGLLRVHETPDGWGLLEAGGDGLRLIRAPDRVEAGPEARAALLASIARSAMCVVNRDLGIIPEDVVRWQAD